MHPVLGCIELCLVAPAGPGSWAFLFPAPVTGMHTHAVVTARGDPVSNQAKYSNLRSGVSGAGRCAVCDGILLCVLMLVVMLGCVTAGDDVESGGQIVPGFKQIA